MDKVKASLLLPQKTEGISNLESIAEGDILRIDNKQFVINALKKVSKEDYRIKVLRREVVDNHEVILQQNYLAYKKGIQTGTLTLISSYSHDTKESFKRYSNQLKLLELKNKQHPY